ncbi:hemicentin-1-like [Dreissena polymorpha]|uniref:hemicentin-1-like n=1 Tax=Dreissena polymorpha TaxID=45954 RepID=UPI0022649E06|nr:hemicentin-1-like [Dreissena polymorpha]
MVIGGCADVDECRTNQHRCYYNQKCVNTEPGYKCVCPRGYRLAGPGTPCFDIDECEETPEVCAYQCENTHGGYECLCAPGQVRLADRKSCAGLEFIDQPTIHDVSSLRANPYTLSKTLHSSSDTVNETRHSNANPARGATTDSTSTKSAARLEVPTVAPSNGYGTEQGQGHVLQGQVVRHTDPVNGFGAEVEWIEVYEKKQKRNKKEKNKDQMEKNRKKAKRGRLTKKCTEGFVLHTGSKECLDIDECTEDPGVCQHNCTNTVGGYNCTCPPGYRISKDKRTCEDVNECIEFEINCGREKMCFNTLGEFTCIDVPCPRGYQRDPITNNCVLECIDAEIACPQSSKFADIIEFRTLALPSGVLAQQDLIRLTAYNQNNEILHRTVFTILENDVLIPFQIRLEDGIGIVYTPRVLEDSRLYKIKVQAKSFDNVKDSIQYQTTFMIHISVSAFPY